MTLAMSVHATRDLTLRETAMFMRNVMKEYCVNILARTDNHFDIIVFVFKHISFVPITFKIDWCTLG